METNRAKAAVPYEFLHWRAGPATKLRKSHFSDINLLILLLYWSVVNAVLGFDTPLMNMEGLTLYDIKFFGFYDSILCVLALRKASNISYSEKLNVPLWLK